MIRLTHNFMFFPAVHIMVVHIMVVHVCIHFFLVVHVWLVMYTRSIQQMVMHMVIVMVDSGCCDGPLVCYMWWMVVCIGVVSTHDMIDVEVFIVMLLPVMGSTRVLIMTLMG